MYTSLDFLCPGFFAFIFGDDKEMKSKLITELVQLKKWYNVIQNNEITISEIIKFVEDQKLLLRKKTKLLDPTFTHSLITLSDKDNTLDTLIKDYSFIDFAINSFLYNASLCIDFKTPPPLNCSLASLRLNADYIFIFRIVSHNELKTIYNNYYIGFPTFEDFNRMVNGLQDNECLIIDKREMKINRYPNYIRRYKIRELFDVR